MAQFRVQTTGVWETLVVLWANTTIGLISFWWIGTRQQKGSGHTHDHKIAVSH